MGKLIPFSNQRHQSVVKDNLFMIHQMENSPIRGEIRVMDDETHALMRVLYDERNVIKDLLKDSTLNRNSQETEYWTLISKTLNGILAKFKKIRPVHEVVEELTLVEMDCLIGVVEEYIHERSLEDMQMIEDATPLITKALLSFYHSAIPVYEGKRLEFDENQKSSK